MVVVIPVQSNAITQQAEPHHQLSKSSKSENTNTKEQKGKVWGVMTFRLQ